MFRSVSKTGIRPIKIGRKLIRAIDAGRTTGVDGRTTAPNVFSVHLNESDRSKFGDLEKPLISELVDAAKQYIVDEGFSLVGEVTVALVTKPDTKLPALLVPPVAVTRIELTMDDDGKTAWTGTNGTMLNGVKISGEQKLRHGDALMFGSTSARFEVA